MSDSRRICELEIALREITTYADVMGDSDDAPLYVDKLWQITEMAKKALGDA